MGPLSEGSGFSIPSRENVGKKISFAGEIRGNIPCPTAYTGVYAGFDPADINYKGADGMEENKTLHPRPAGEGPDLEDLIYGGEVRTVSDR